MLKGRQKGYKLSEESKRKIGLANSVALKGRRLSKETRKRISISNKGKVVLAETREKLSKRQKGKHNSFKTEFKKGHVVLEEQRIKIRNKLIGRNTGDKNPSWKGGLSFEPYSVDWTKTLKRAIKERDKYTCGMCKNQEDLVVHHKDRNKKNCNPNNLITLCRKCHSKIHKMWTEEELNKIKHADKL